MFSFLRRLSKKAALFSLGLTFAAISPLALTVSVSAQETPPVTTPSPTTSPTATSFTDVSADYWANPFIQALAQRNIIAGFGDRTFKPEQAVTRAEFAAMIQKAFNQNSVRQLPQGGFSDVPANYWAAAAIQEAYETGFMSGYPQNRFQPNQRIIKVDAIVSLGSGLGLTGGDINSLSTYFTDASGIPSYATDRVAAATTANVIVNYPDVKVLNPTTPLTRAEAAAHLYQALVRLGQVQPLASNVPAASYIVAGTPPQDTGSTPTPSNSFNTLTSLIQAAGLESTLQQGQYTIFAPTDAAFAALPPETLQRLQQPENKATLARILQYHVVPGQLTASQLTTGELQTVEKKAVNVQVSNNQITVNNAQVIQADIQANNGVIHAINQVLIPPDVSLDGQSPTDPAVTPGRATRGGRSYLGVAGNIGLGGDTGLAEGSFAVISKIGLTNNFSARPSVVINDDTVVLVPLTFDFVPQAANPTGDRVFSISPYIGAGVAIETSNDSDIGLLLTGGVDVPLGNRFTINGAVNAAFLGSTDVGLMLGVGFNF
ncbi:fasciclin domain-containing protein [Calothrix sp. PCC 6303]|uniref:fasciclin domain-containing protein n=1 Tax=Calothrix sp. PCC 6303 TaxID=1170562 RepID=UPI0002A03EE6|nr:fasciclin domain-containing protein [Calothrix sp. PCC 6303]AFZ00949.1 beta-Ig-H3/fasciclin [Calothrix sp. PCC 6303]